MFKMNSWHLVKAQSPQPGEGLELVLESCGSGSESCPVLTLGSEAVGRGRLGESAGPGPRDCAVTAAASHPAPRVVWFCSRATRLCYSCVNTYGIPTLLGSTLHLSVVDLLKRMLF